MPGLSFSPFNQQPGQQAPGQASAPVQDAIKVLSFRMPSVVGGGAPTGAGLMGGQSAGGTNGSLALQFLQRFLQGQGPAGMPPSPQAPQGPPGPGGGGPGLGATNPFAAPPPPSGGIGNMGLQPNVQFGGGGLPRAPDPTAPPPDQGGYNPGDPPPYLPGAPPSDTGGIDFSQPNPNPVSTMPMPRSPQQGWGGFMGGPGGPGMGGRF